MAFVLIGLQLFGLVSCFICRYCVAASNTTRLRGAASFAGTFAQTGQEILLKTTNPHEATLLQGIPMYKNHLTDRLDRAVTAFRLPLGNNTDVRALGALVVSRCGKKDITGESGDKDSAGNLVNPCLTRCNGGLEGKESGSCYPSKVEASDPPYYKGRTVAIVPIFYAKLQVVGHPHACNACQWESKSCDERQHHCTLVLSECECSGFPENSVLEIIASSVTGDGLAAGETWLMELEDKGFLAAVSTVGYEGHAPNAVAFEEGSRQPAQHDDDSSDFDPVYHHLVSTPMLASTKGNVAIVRAAFTVKLKFNHSDRDDCDPLIGGRFLLTEGEPSSMSTKQSNLPGKKEFKFKLAENCPDRQDAKCLFHMVDVGKLKNDYQNPYVTLAVKASRTCVQKDESDLWKSKGGWISVETIS